MMAGREHMVRNEIAVLKKVSMGHQNILTLVDYFETMNNLYLVTDLALGGELFDRICRKGSYYESDAADLIRATLSAVAYLHDHGIVHRDLKPENLLFRTPEDNADLLIADFGLSRIMDEEAFHVLTTTCGTPGYMAPEIFNKSGHGKPRCLGHRCHHLLPPVRLHALRPGFESRRNASNTNCRLLLHTSRVLARRLP